MNETVEKTETGAILYDKAIVNQISDAGFSPDAWHEAAPVKGSLRSAGRGNTLLVSDGTSDFVLRHYMRGGMIGRIIRDRYLWLGQNRTRSFAEWRLLARLTEMGLPVPRPAAARYRRALFCYTADLLTVRAPNITPLSARISRQAGGADFWCGIGRGIRRFHAAGVYHADLNAYNVQVDGQDNIFVLDFDRGRLRPGGAWQQQNLKRLRRSLRKIKRLDSQVHFEDADWDQLVEGYGAGPEVL